MGKISSMFLQKNLNTKTEDSDNYNLKETNKCDKMQTVVGAKVENGKIIVCKKPSDNDSETVTIKSCDGIELLINGQPCDNKTLYTITELDKIEYISKKTEAIRNFNIETSEDKMKCYVIVEYIPEYTYELVDKSIHRNLALKTKRVEGNYPNKYTISEAKEILKKNNIIEGIIYRNLIEACSSLKCENMLIATGIPAVDDKPTEIKILFDLEEKKVLNELSEDKIDYKNLYSIANIEAGQLLAEIIPSEIGKDGKNICGEILKRKSIKDKPIKIGEGCKIDNDKIIATKTGRPCCKKGIVSVNSVYSIDNVDLKSGNIRFSGNVDISECISEGMEVKAGNAVNVVKNIDSAKVVASGEINVKGNVINSTLFTGQIDMEKKLYLDNLKEYNSILEQIIHTVNEVLESNNNFKKIGEIVKILIEKRFKTIPKLSLNIITHSICEDDGNIELVNFIRNKMMALNVLKIKSLEELSQLKELLENEIDFFSDGIIVPADIKIGYCQDCVIKSTGNIIIDGKGEYVSTLTALENIEFTQKDSVARGGIISAGKNIKLGIVGSPAGVVTRLEVAKTGIITANIAYINTVFCFDKKSRILDVSGKDIKAYMKEDGEIIIEKFAL
ncbi:DUF342 domain-containing protein [Clostridium saccharobutylicum]|uniref:Polymerase n=2 Tax=Clostridium saccharobutylicum TaxID=169679 RepID=U5MQW2_CLOSA|nr:FapA family protein [Clostridium saccharobutylicum]AGX43199.1 polymerase [Clostridium saccharobutylicum DSM 13864]AQR90498.1 hypothetical protein CLOSC_22170 [Clostridium saccharobutylicum]AQS00404.1 hypothetical protein CSACC_22240 [Clostridium saccharobutylicum]AQS14387.1 hypothetical protein CLOSACC_22240 [Clostridium saccharobutylicum]MBA2906862.1 hypothetical protein [Clostridium saccharobutylicum]